MNSPYSRDIDDEEFSFELTVKGTPACCCLNRYQQLISFVALLCVSASVTSWYVIFTEGIPLYEAAIESFIGFIICFIVVLGARSMTVRGNDVGLRVDYGPCPCYQRCLCCGCCVPRARGEANYDVIQSVQLVEQSQCLDGCGINENRCNNLWVMNVGCCVPSVVITRSYDPRAGCCAYTNLMIGFDTTEQAQELVSFLEEKLNNRDIEQGRNNGNTNGSMPAIRPIAINPNAPPARGMVQP